MIEQLTLHLRRHFGDCDDVVIEAFDAIPGGYSRETYRFDARIRRGVVERLYPMILRKDPPAAAAILQTSRQTEHELIEAIRANTGVPVSESYFHVMDPEPFGEPAMVIERMAGSGMTSNLFHGGPDADQAESVIGHLCELLAELHLADTAKLNAGGRLSDPRGVGIDISSWDSYMESTFQYYLDGYKEGDFEPFAVLMDAYLTLRRDKPRPLRLSLVHGDFNPVNFLYQDGRVSAVIDWENARIGDPREDLGWMQTMDILSNTQVLQYPKAKGGFLAYYNELTGFGVTQAEVDYFTLFATSNIAVPILAAIKRRAMREHTQLLHFYALQPSINNLVNFAKIMRYPGVA